MVGRHDLNFHLSLTLSCTKDTENGGMFEVAVEAFDISSSW
jgi:hypothetical protein